MTEPDDKVGRWEKTKAFRALIFGGKVGGAFAGISAGIAVIAKCLSFLASDNGDYVMPIVLMFISIAGFVVHFRKSPILSAPFIMFALFGTAVVCFGIWMYLCLAAGIGEAFSQTNQFDFVLQIAATMKAEQSNKPPTDEMIEEFVQKAKASIQAQSEHRISVSWCWLAAGAIVGMTSLYGFFSRLWQIENAIIDTQLRMLLMCDHSVKLANDLETMIQTTDLYVADVEKPKFKDVSTSASKNRNELLALRSTMKDLPAVGYRRGRLLFFKRPKEN